jgi:hypothetical protein
MEISQKILKTGGNYLHHNNRPCRKQRYATILMIAGVAQFLEIIGRFTLVIGCSLKAQQRYRTTTRFDE